MTPQEFGLLLISILASTGGQLFLKTGALKLGQTGINSIFSVVWGIVVTPELMLGMLCYGMGALTYIMVLSRVKLSVAAPSAALAYVFSVFIGYFVFRESIPVERLVGLGLIVCGVTLVVWQR